MIEINDEYQCCGCTACANICPKNCITMAPDEEGFLYPETDRDLCINCGLCEKVCPVINAPENLHGEVESYVVRAKDDEVLSGSTSGGFFTPVAEYVLSENGVVCAATFDEDWNVVHEFITSREADISKYRGSKYVQSNLGSCFSRIKEYLVSNRLVLFVGTPCQVAGLKNYLQKEYENLITVDLVCHGASSPKLWGEYVAFQSNQFHSTIRNISFRNKTYGYHSGTMKIEFDNGEVYYGSARVDYMLKSFFSEISSRPICYKCPFKGIKRCSDFTIYDCWHFSKLLIGKGDDDKGYTNVIVHSKKATDILKILADELEIYQVDTQKAIELDGVMATKSAVPHPRRKEYYKDLDKVILSQHIQKFIPVTKKDILIEKSKSVLYKLKIFRWIKRFK